MSTTAPITVTVAEPLAILPDSANYCALSEDVAVATSRDGTVCAINLLTNKANFFHGHADAAHQCTLSSNGRAAATASFDGTVQIWNTANPKEIWKVLSHPGHDRALGVALSRDSTTLAVSFENRLNKRGTISVWSLVHSPGVTEFHQVAAWNVNLDVFNAAVAISDDGTIVAHCARGRVYAMHVENAKSPFKRWRISGAGHVAMAGDASCFAVADDTKLRLWKVAEEDGGEFELAGYVRSFRPFCAMSLDGKRVVAAMVDNKFRIWCTEKRAVLADVVGFQDHTRGCAVHPDGSRFLLCGFDNTVRLLDLEKEMDAVDFGPASIDEPVKMTVRTSFEKEIDSCPDETDGDVTGETSAQVETEDIGNRPGDDLTHTMSLGKSEKTESSIIEDVSEEPQPEVSAPGSEEMSGKVAQLTHEFENMANSDVSSNNILQCAAENEDHMSHSSATKEETEVASQIASTDIDVDAKVVFAKNLEAYGRTKSLLHIQAAEAMADLFSSSDLTSLGRHTVGLVLLEQDSQHTWQITETQFVDASRMVAKAIGASKSNAWTKAFLKTAESREGLLTLAQAVMTIIEFPEDKSPGTSIIVEAIEKASFEGNAGAPVTTVSLDVFLKAVVGLGFQV